MFGIKNTGTMQISDDEILTAFARSVDEGGKLLFRRYYKPLVLFSGSLLNDDVYTEDMVQDVFYHFIRTRAYLRLEPGALGTFLFRSVKNACLNRIRNNREVSTADFLAHEVEEEEALTVSPELMEAIHAAIDALPEKTRAAILGVIVDGKRYKEVAESLNVSVNTVKTLLAHGLKQLRAQFPDPAILFLALCKGL